MPFPKAVGRQSISQKENELHQFKEFKIFDPTSCDYPNLFSSDVDSKWKEQFDLVRPIFDTTENYINLLYNPPKEIQQFSSFIQSQIQPDDFHIFLNHWPPACRNSLVPVIHNLLCFVQSSKYPTTVLSWLAMMVEPKNWYELKQSEFRFCICEMKSGMSIDHSCKYFAILYNNRFTLMYTQQKNTLNVRASIHCDEWSASRSKKSIRIFANGEMRVRIYPINPEQVNLWTDNSTPFPLYITSIFHPLPPCILPALYNAIIADDMLIARCLTHFSVTKVLEGITLANSLLDIFAYAGKVQNLLLMLVVEEFENDSLTHTTVLRTNSHLTCMFKVFYQRYGRYYYDNFLHKVVKYIISKGDINLSKPDQCDTEEARTDRQLLIHCPAFYAFVLLMRLYQIQRHSIHLFLISHQLKLFQFRKYYKWFSI